MSGNEVNIHGKGEKETLAFKGGIRDEKENHKKSSYNSKLNDLIRFSDLQQRDNCCGLRGGQIPEGNVSAIYLQKNGNLRVLEHEFVQFRAV